MYGDLTNTDVIKQIEQSFEKQEQEQVEILLYKKTREYRVTSGVSLKVVMKITSSLHMFDMSLHNKLYLPCYG